MSNCSLAVAGSPITNRHDLSNEMRGERVVITGVTGQIAFGLAKHLAEHNDVFGVARFSRPGSHDAVIEAGITPIECDIADGDFSSVPSDVTYLLHLAVAQGPGFDYDKAIRTNAEGTGLLLQHCRAAKAALVMSTHSVYKPHEDPFHVYRESDPLGDPNVTHAPTYGVSKIGQEAVARTCARLFDLPVVIARMNAAYDERGGLPTIHLRQLLAGQSITTRWDPCTYQPIHQTDINLGVAGLLNAATAPATIVNWAGDEVVSVQEWTAYMAELLGIDTTVNCVEVPGSLRGSVADVTKRLAATGPCIVSWRDGIADAVNKLTA